MVPTWTDGTKYKVYVQAYDVSQNTSTVVTSTFTYDTTPPSTLITVPSGDHHARVTPGTRSAHAS